MKLVLTNPEASPESAGDTSLIAASSTGLNASPAPNPSSTMPGNTCVAKSPSTGANANKPRPAAAISNPTANGPRIP